MALHLIKGDALYPNTPGNKIIVHICNDVGVWGGGFTKYLSKRWKKPEVAYRSLKSRKLGSVEFVQTESDFWVANIIGQHSIITWTRSKDIPPIRYEAVKNALKVVAEKCLEFQASVHMPRIGCGLAGGKWEEIEPIIQQELVMAGIDVYVYDLYSTESVNKRAGSLQGITSKHRSHQLKIRERTPVQKSGRFRDVRQRTPTASPRTTI